MKDGPEECRRPTMIYWTSVDGTISRVESQNADLIHPGDEDFAASFSSTRIVGCNLFQFINGREVTYIYESLAARVIDTGRTVAFVSRCDSPGVRRDMSMELSRDESMVRWMSVTVKETAREKEIPVDTPGAPTLVAICSFCKNYRFPVSSEVWKELENLLMEDKLPAQFSFSHGVCDVCYRMAMGEE